MQLKAEMQHFCFFTNAVSFLCEPRNNLSNLLISNRDFLVWHPSSLTIRNSKLDSDVLLLGIHFSKWILQKSKSCFTPIHLFFTAYVLQKCILKFGSWSYHGLSLDIYHSGPGDTEAFTDNGEWVLVGMPVTKFITKYRCCPEPYPFITYNIIIRRRTMYYILNFLTPCVLMSALTILGFFLPVESGERMNVGVTVLLSLTVILLLLAEELPATSEVVPLISRYYTLTMINVFISIVFTCVVLTFHHHAPTPLPAWVRLFICQWCANALRVRRNGNQNESCLPAKRFLKNRNMRRHSLGERLYSQESAEPVATNPFLNANHAQPPGSASTVSIQLKKLDDRNPTVRKRGNQGLKQSEALDILVERTKKDDEKERHKEEWRFAAQVLNRLFMWIVLFLVVFNCLSVLFSAPSENLN